MSGGNYRCKDCGESVDPKGSPRECDGPREDLLARIAQLEEVAAAARRIVTGVECCKELILNGDDYDALDDALTALDGPKIEAGGPPEPVMVVGRGVAGMVPRGSRTRRTGMHRIDGTELAIGDEHERMLADVKDLQAAYVALLSAPDNANLQQAYLQALERFGPEGWAASRIAK